MGPSKVAKVVGKHTSAENGGLKRRLAVVGGSVSSAHGILRI